MNSSKRTAIISSGSLDNHYWEDVWRHRELIAFLAWRDLLVRYKQTVVGIAWTVIKPLSTLLVYTLIFGYVAQLPSNGIPYTLIVLTGLLPWQLFSVVFTVASDSLVVNGQLVSKVYFPRIVIPISSVFVCIVDHLVALILLAMLVAWYGVFPGWQILVLPFVILLTTLTGFGLGLAVSALNAHYRDFRQLIPVALQLGVFASPVAYATTLVPAGTWRLLYSLNPIVGVIDAFRWCILGSNAIIFPPSIIVTLVFAASSLAIGLRVFRRLEPTLADVM